MRSSVFFWVIFFIGASLFSCKVKETTTSTRVIHDTLTVKEVVTITPPTRNVTIIESPCKGDTLKPISNISKFEKGTIKVSNDGGDLRVEVNIDSIVNSRLEQERLKTDTSVKEVVITRYRVPSWMWYVVVYATLLTAWTFRRFIPILNLIP